MKQIFCLSLIGFFRLLGVVFFECPFERPGASTTTNDENNEFSTPPHVGIWRVCVSLLTAVVLGLKAWEAFLSILEEIEDVELIRDRLKNWRSKEGWTRWEDFETE